MEKHIESWEEFDKLRHNISETLCCSLRIEDSPQLAAESFNTGGNTCIGEKCFRRIKGAPYLPEVHKLPSLIFIVGF
jgi:hypothetical protein